MATYARADENLLSMVLVGYESQKGDETHSQRTSTRTARRSAKKKVGGPKAG